MDEFYVNILTLDIHKDIETTELLQFVQDSYSSDVKFEDDIIKFEYNEYLLELEFGRGGSVVIKGDHAYIVMELYKDLNIHFNNFILD